MSCRACECFCPHCQEPCTCEEEREASRLRQEERLAKRMTPARNAQEQLDRDMSDVMSKVVKDLEEAVFGPQSSL